MATKKIAKSADAAPIQPPAAAAGAPLRILHVASEMVPFSKTGGLADVVAALPAALVRLGHDARVVVPCYRKTYLVAERLGVTWLAKPLVIEAGGIDHLVGVGVVVHQGVTVYLMACNELFDREGVYGPSPSHDYDDNARRYAVLAKAALALPGAVNWFPHVVHAHDWQAGLVPVLLERGFNRMLPAARSVFSIHNIAYQGGFPPADMRLAGLDPWLFNPMQCEHFGRFNWLKSGIVFATRVTTVSRRYATEIQDPAFAYTMDAVISHHRYKLDGITNGIDPMEWDPTRDAHIGTHFHAGDLAGKGACKQALRAHCGLTQVADTALAVVVSRLVEQKGIDLILDAVEPYILAGRMQLAVLGAGDLHLEHRLYALQQRHPGWVYAWYGYNEPLAHQFVAGGDLFLMPSRTEPCGLTQMYAMRYGTLPLVRYTGGLADTVTDVTTPDGTGFTFGPVDGGHFSAVLDRALGLFRHFPAEWRAAQLRAMAQDNSWDKAGADYVQLYRGISVPT
jgi:starch synthase